ncbi:type II toxin-antitoxin system RelE/ParE family toxin [Candidatus Roizmanbacteria bacterium]|nr:type II toxin-antitoxin system RelE/ParE family toxin [Candidatus Roizmanbacteria bacterium]
MINYSIYSYRTSSGKKIIDEITLKFDEKSQLKMREAIRLLKLYGLALLKTQRVKKIWQNPPIYELRVKGIIEMRLLFSFFKPRLFAIVNIFTKKTNKIPKKEIDLAIKRIRELNKS